MAEQDTPAPSSRQDWETVCLNWKEPKHGEAECNAVSDALATEKDRGQATMFERGSHISLQHMEYFKPPKNAFLAELKNRDRRSHKEWEYINAAGVWAEVGIVALELAKSSTTVESGVKLLSLAETSLKASIKVLSMRGQYFKDIIEK